MDIEEMLPLMLLVFLKKEVEQKPSPVTAYGVYMG
jgi:hypothetical protein